MRTAVVALIGIALVASAAFGGCITGKQEEKGMGADGQDMARPKHYAVFDLSKYNAMLPSGENAFNDIMLFSNAFGVRAVNTPQHDLAAQMMFDRLKSYGLDT